ncbi:putative glucose-6-phosphate 1-epimerase isoform X2 [Carica papaya]|uniref:putative glucose-6-phosphate 1-epimerase isoform X2 n=1 Tax=Carica papaya TaxID=3649 RepID=UPI000B8D0A21|nr:putative glucose-6-phosphate 1-epimerase isoform X2 [Carica papaya]
MNQTSDEITPFQITKDRNGIDQVLLRNPRGASVRVSLHGGQVLSWKTDRGEELLFTSSKAVFKPPHPVRGGIPICFPQFGQRESLEQHGFARNKIWAIDANPPPLHPNDSNGKPSIDLLLRPSEDDLKIWPHSYEFRLRVSLGADGNLTMIARIRNVNCKPFSFSIAFRTYFSISDISEVRVEGLETLDYLDNLLQKEHFTEQGDALTFESEVRGSLHCVKNWVMNDKLKCPYSKFSQRNRSRKWKCELALMVSDFPNLRSVTWCFLSNLQIDRVYLNSRDVAIFDHEKKRTFVIRKEGLPDVAVWNPWEKKSKAIADLGDEEYKQMICVDGAAIEKSITLKPGEEWTGRLELSAVPSS